MWNFWFKLIQAFERYYGHKLKHKRKLYFSLHPSVRRIMFWKLASLASGCELRIATHIILDNQRGRVEGLRNCILWVQYYECQVRTCSNCWKVTLSGRESHRYRNNRSGTATVDKDLPSDGITLTAPYLIFVIYFLQYPYVDMSSILRAKDSVLRSMTDQICCILWNGFIFRLVVVSSELLAYYFAYVF